MLRFSILKVVSFNENLILFVLQKDKKKNSQLFYCFYDEKNITIL